MIQGKPERQGTNDGRQGQANPGEHTEGAMMGRSESKDAGRAVILECVGQDIYGRAGVVASR